MRCSHSIYTPIGTSSAVRNNDNNNPWKCTKIAETVERMSERTKIQIELNANRTCLLFSCCLRYTRISVDRNRNCGGERLLETTGRIRKHQLFYRQILAAFTAVCVRKRVCDTVVVGM